MCHLIKFINISTCDRQTDGWTDGWAMRQMDSQTDDAEEIPLRQFSYAGDTKSKIF